jgi:NADH:ubiquinone oxidoreductase subunit K
MTIEIAVISIFILLFFFYINQNIIKNYYNTALGKLFAIVTIILSTHINIGLGITVLVLVIIYYKFYDNTITNIHYLDGIDCIYWINLDRSIDRKQKMEEMFTDPIFIGKPIKRIEAVDGKTVILRNKINHLAMLHFLNF